MEFIAVFQELQEETYAIYPPPAPPSPEPPKPATPPPPASDGETQEVEGEKPEDSASSDPGKVGRGEAWGKGEEDRAGGRDTHVRVAGKSKPMEVYNRRNWLDECMC